MSLDVDHLNVSQSIAVLGRTPETLKGMLIGLPETLLLRNEGQETFSPYAVVGHLISGEETDWIPRMRTILEHGESVPFEPWDRFAFRGWEARPMRQMLDRFQELRNRNVEELRSVELTPEQLALRGTHPEFGPVTLGELIGAWVVHDLDHIGQISRVLAKQFGDHVGPWREYMPVLTRY